jgi:hypothetical protein
VITLIRLAVRLACAVGAASSFALAQVVSPTVYNGASAADLVAFLSTLPRWSVSTSLAASYGFKDNLLLSFAAEERSPFVRGGVEVVLLRVPQDQFDFSFFAEAERTQYTSGHTLDDDAKVWVRTEPAYRLGDTLKFSLPVTGYYYDQVFDVSDTEVERLVAELKMTGIMIGPSVRWDFHPLWIEAQAVGQRKRYDDRVNDGDIGEGSLRVGWQRGAWLEVQISGAQRWRDFESRAQYSAAGRELGGTELKISEREGEARFDITWDAAAHWETSTRVSILHYRDNGSGYFNYREERVAQELEWNAKPWFVRVGGSAGRINFGVQTVGLGVSPPARLRDEYTAEVEVNRQVGPRWTVFGGYLWERTRSNDPVASYRVNEGFLGLRWTWEK